MIADDWDRIKNEINPRLNFKEQAKTILPCPFCKNDNIVIIEDKQKKGILKDSLYTYCWCKLCGAKGPWAYSLESDLQIIVEKCIVRWNERSKKNLVR